MDIRQLRYFEAFARHRHFTKAAHELHVAQSAISHQVRQLEREVGVELLRRTTRSVEPTEAGALVAARARAVLAQTDALHSEIDELRGLVRGRLTVGAMLFGGELDIPALLSSFTTAFPDVDVEIREGTAARMLELLANGTLDLAFALEIDPPPGVQRVELSSEELAVAVGPTHPLAGDEPLSLTELGEHSLIAFSPGSSTRKRLDAALSAAGVQPRIAIESTDLALSRSLAASGLGVAVLPCSFLERPGARVSIRPLVPALRLRVVLWWPEGRRLSPGARAFVDFARTSRKPDPHPGAPPTPPPPRGRRARGTDVRSRPPDARSLPPERAAR
jgi:DNA-binding transcriptional LysR family regulator